jgi:putative ABC transport system permease protein
MSQMRRVPIGRRNLFVDRRRAVLGIAGVTVAFLMILALDGIVDGATKQLTRYIDTSSANVFVAQRGVTNMHMASSALPLADVATIRALPGVSWADPILYSPDTLASTRGRQLTYVIGYLPGGRGGPVKLTAGREPAPGQIVLDKRGAQNLNLGVGDAVHALGRSWQISGLTSGLTNIANTVAFVRFDDFAAARSVRGVASYILVGGTAAPDQLARRITAATGLSALPKARFSAKEHELAKDMTTEILQIMTLAAFVIGMAVIGLTLYTATLSRLREIGVMKALGADGRRLADVVLAQALWTVGAALALALGLSLGLAWVLERFTDNLTVTVQAPAVLRVALGGLLLAALGATAPLLKFWRVDPASVFRR